MDVHELTKLDLLELEDNWVEKSQTTVLERGNGREEERFEYITWIDDVIDIDEVDMWEEKRGKEREREGKRGKKKVQENARTGELEDGRWKMGRWKMEDGRMGGWEDERKVKKEENR